LQLTKQNGMKSAIKKRKLLAAVIDVFFAFITHVVLIEEFPIAFT